MAGTIPLSMTQQFDVYGKPLSGGQLYIIQAGTVSTPQDAFQDTGLLVKQPYPMTLDAAGRVPQFFVADGTIKLRLQDYKGVVQLAADSVLVIGPSSGGGGGSSIDPTQLIQTGMMMFQHSTAIVGGFVRLGGRTIGSSTSGATERANSDTQALFLYLWPDTTLLIYSGGSSVARGASAALDWAANRAIALPDWRGYGLGALDDMGNTPSGRLTATYFGAIATVLGAVGGGEFFTLAATHIPAAGLSVSGTTGVDSPDHTHAYQQASSSGAQKPSGAGSTPLDGTSPTNSGGASARHAHSFSAALAGGGGQAHRTIGPRKLVTFYMKL